MTYSTPCHLVTRLIRLPTIALPATAPICGSPNQRARRAMVSGSNWVSASSATTISPLATASARLSAWALPPLLRVRRRTRESPPKTRVTISLVPSVEPSSTTITSISASVLSSTRLTELSITLASLNAGMITETNWLGSMAGAALRLAATWLRQASAAIMTARTMPSAMATKNSHLIRYCAAANIKNAPTSARTDMSWPLGTSGITVSRLVPIICETLANL